MSFNKNNALYLFKRCRLIMPKIVAKQIDWIMLGYTLFADKGIAGINVDEMSRRLSCNKSSFYWHFKSKDNFIQLLLEYWVEKDTQNIMDRTKIDLSPIKRLFTFYTLVFKKDDHLDFIFYLKKYAQSRPELKGFLEQIDVKRIAFVENLLMDLDFEKEEAVVRAEAFYKFLIGYHEMIRYKNQPHEYIADVLPQLQLIIPINAS